MKIPQTARDILRGRCPRCRRGAIFRRLMQMHTRCPQCDLLFDREPGYFLGALVFSYAISIVAYGFLYALLKREAQEPPDIFILFEMLIIYLPFVPFVFRYSRILWIYLDQKWDPAA